MGDQTSLVSRQEREANAKNQPMFHKRLFKDVLIAISGSFRTGTSNAARRMMSFLGPRPRAHDGRTRDEGTAEHARGAVSCLRGDT